MPPVKFYTGAEVQSDRHFSTPWNAGVAFLVNADNVRITGVQFRKYQNPETVSVHLWSATGTLLATGTAAVAAPAANGSWYEISFATPVDLTNGTTYIVSRFISGSDWAPFINPGVWPRTAGSLASTMGSTPARYVATGTPTTPPLTTDTKDYLCGPILEQTAPPTPAGPLGISLAPDDTALIAAPTWERIDDVYNVQAWTIDRGRQNEMSKTDTGTATIELVDRTGDFDPTNTTGAFYGRLTAGQPMGPLVQAAIALQNPVTDAWSTLFRGHIASIQWVPYRSEQHANVTLELTDGLAFLAACEMAPSATGGVADFGHEIFEGNIVFHEDNTLDAVQTRINKVLDQAKWPAALRSIFTGNVKLQKTPYAPRSTVLSVIQDAADAEFPDVANVYIGGPRFPGYLVFHGRFARFNPANVDYDIRTWKTGDDAAATADPTHVVPISPPLVASLDDTLLYTSALSTPQNIADGDIAAQYVTDTAAADKKGLRTWSAENLATFGGATTATAEAETKLYADYVRDNYKTPRVRVGQLTIKSRRPSSTSGPTAWAMLCGVDISDIVHLKTTHGGGGGFDTDFYVEGIHYQARPGGLNPYIELTLDVSPRGYYDSNPFGTDPT